jgi:hypothetical protein
MYNLRDYKERDIIRVVIDKNQVNTPQKLEQGNQ